MSSHALQQHQNTPKQIRNPVASHSHASNASDPDEIQVIEETKPIPIQDNRIREHGVRHDHLFVGTVHDRKIRSSPLARFCKRDDIDLITDSMDSGEENYEVDSGRDERVRGRGRRTKPLLQARQLSPQGRSYRKKLNHLQDPFSPDGYRPIIGIDQASRDTERYQVEEDHGSQAKTSYLSQRDADVLDLEAPVFDFEESSPLSSTTELEPKSECSLDGPYFWRPAMHMYTYSGAFQPVDTSARPTENDTQAGAEANQAAAQRKRHRLGHHRAASELFLSPSSCARVADSRSTRRRATVGSQESYRLPPFARRENLPA